MRCPASWARVGRSSKASELDGKFPIAPISVVQFFGEPSRDVDIDLRVKKGTILAHWPPGSERAGRIQWFKSDLTKAPGRGDPDRLSPGGPLAPWPSQGRNLLYHQRESRAERFLAYDTELTVPIPLKLRGGPDEYTLQSLTEYRLLDVAVIAPTENGYRVGWLDDLPSGTPDGKDGTSVKKAKEKGSSGTEKKSSTEKAAEVFEKADEDARRKARRRRRTPPSLSRPKGMRVSRRVDQVLNRPITVNVEQAPRKEVLDLVTSQARIRYELDEKTLIKEEVDLGKTMTLKAGNLAAPRCPGRGARHGRPELPRHRGREVSSSPRPPGSLERHRQEGAVIEGPPVKLTPLTALEGGGSIPPPSHRETRPGLVHPAAGRPGFA